MYSAYIRPETEVRGSLRLITPEPAGRGSYKPQTSDDQGRGSYIGAIHRITVVHKIYTMVYGLRFPAQIFPRLYTTIVYCSFSFKLPQGSWLLVRFCFSLTESASCVPWCNLLGYPSILLPRTMANGEKENLCPRTLSGSACL